MSIFVRRDDYNTKKKVENCSDSIMIGVLALDEDDIPIIAPFDSQLNNYFLVRPLCDDLLPLNELNSEDDTNDYVGIDIQQTNSFLPDDYRRNQANSIRIEMLADFLYQRLIIFRPYFNTNRSSPDFIHKNLHIVDLIDVNDDRRMEFYCIPRLTMDVNTFKERMREGAYISFVDYNSEHRNAPEFVICGDNIFYTDSVWEKYESQNKMWRCKDYSKVKQFALKIDVNLSASKLVKGSDNLFFLNKDYAVELQLLTNIISLMPSPGIEFKVSSKNQEPNIPEKEPAIMNQDDLSQNVQMINEFDFLESFKQLTVNNDLIYKEQDLFNLHTCIKSNTLTIIAGMSGTGKTQLALNYANMLDLDEENRTLLFLPISPSYTEPEDILGYYSNSNKEYHPASTGLVDFLNHAHQDLNKLHMVIFDEMNLSQIEFWFSPFISIMERIPNERFLTLYNEKEECLNKDNYPARLKINENVIFIGTVNLDETTKEISDRLLDRSFVISLEKQKFAQTTTYLSKDKKGNLDSIEGHKCRNTQTYDQWRTKVEQGTRNLTDVELRFFDDIHETISKLDSQKGISFRVIRNINSYLNNIPLRNKSDETSGIISRSDALDILFKQTVLSKIKGSDNQLSELLGTLDESGHYNEGDLVHVFDTYHQISDFGSSRKEIERKVRDISQYGYTR